MSIAPAEPQSDPGVPIPKTVPRLPVVQFSPRDPLLRMHCSLTEMNDAARDAPRDVFYDVRGILLKPARNPDELLLEARGEARPAALRERAMNVLRDMIGRSKLDTTEAAENEAILRWLDAAPTIVHLLHGTGLAPVDYRGPMKGRHCLNCSSWQRITQGNRCC